MDNYHFILLNNSIIYLIAFFISLFGTIFSIIPLSMKHFKNIKAIGIRQGILQQLLIWIIPAMLIISSTWLCSNMLLDFVKNDFKQSEGMVISANYGRGGSKLIAKINGITYSIPIEVKNGDRPMQGKRYMFIYAQRSKLILDYNLVENN